MTPDVETQIIGALIPIFILVFPIIWHYTAVKIEALAKAAEETVKKDLPANVYAHIEQAAKLGISAAKTLNMSGVIQKDIASFVNAAFANAKVYLDHNGIAFNSELLQNTILSNIDDTTSKWFAGKSVVTPPESPQPPVPPSPGVG